MVVVEATFPRSPINQAVEEAMFHRSLISRVAVATRAVIRLLNNLEANITRISRHRRDIPAARNVISSGSNSLASANSTRRSSPCTARRIRNSINDTRAAANTCARISLSSSNNKVTRSRTTCRISSSNRAICLNSSKDEAIRPSNSRAINSRGSTPYQVPRACPALLALRSRAITGLRPKSKAASSKFNTTPQRPRVLRGNDSYF